jgi:hypothetical protein
MGKVRFYTLDGANYCSLRVEADGLYLLGDKVRVHKKRETMPPKTRSTHHDTETSSSYYAAIKDDQVLEKLIAVFEDFEQTFRLDEKAMATVKPGYKKSGYDCSFKYRDDWTTVSGKSVLEALLSYYREIIEE